MYSYYSFGEKLKNIKALIYTKFFWKKARLIRLPVYVRNKKSITYDEGFTTGYNLRLEAGDDKKTIQIGKNVIIGDYCHIVGRQSLVIGDNVLIASRVFITDTSHGNYKNDKQNSNPEEAPNKRMLEYKNVKIGMNCWIGENVCILPGVNVGDGCIIGANSVVTKSFPANCILAGNPAKIIKEYDKKVQKWKVINNKI